MFTKPHHHYHKKRRHISHFFRYSKDGVITGSADNDPSGIVTYTQVGAATGFSQLWLLLLSLPMLTVVEEMSARVGVVTKKGLNKVIAHHFGKKLGIFAAVVVSICNIATIGADVAAMASIGSIVSGISINILVVALTVFFGYFIIKENYQTLSRFLFLLTPIFLLYVATAIVVNPSWIEVFRNTFIPSGFAGSEYLVLAVALLGTTISPYLLFWQTTEEVEEHKTVPDLKDENKGVFFGMAYSHFIFYFIIVASGAVFFGNHVIIDTAQAAAEALKPLAGDWAFLLFSLGILGAGTIAVPVLASSTGYVVADTLDLQEGVSKPYKKAHGFYGVILASLVVGMVIALSGLNPMQMLIYSQVLNGILMPILLFLLIRVTSNKEIMGEHINSRLANGVGWLTVLVFILFDGALIWSFVS